MFYTVKKCTQEKFPKFLACLALWRKDNIERLYKIIFN